MSSVKFSLPRITTHPFSGSSPRN